MKVSIPRFRSTKSATYVQPGTSENTRLSSHGVQFPGLTRGKGSRRDPDGATSGREKALYRLGRVSTAAYFSASHLKEGGGDMSASIKT